MPAALEDVQVPPAGDPRYFAINAAASASLDVRDTRSKRFVLLDGLQRVTQLDRLSHCRRDPHGMAEFVGIVTRDGLASYSGLQTCGSVWACPIDSAKIRHERTMRLARVVLDHLDAGGGALFPTLTLAHVKRDPLAATLGHVLDGWRHVTALRSYKAWRASLGIEHAVKTVEITHGLNGWHPHVHGLMLTAAPPSEDDARTAMAVLWKGWNGYAEKHRLRVLIPTRAVTVKAVDVSTRKGIENLSEYLFKTQDGYGIAAELVRADLKRGRAKSSRVPFQIADSAISGRRSDLDLWLEYEAATKGRRVMDWTKGSAQELGFDDTDEDIAAASPDDTALLADLTPYEWSLVVRYRRRGYLLNVADLAGADGVHSALASLRRRDRYEASRRARRAGAAAR